MKPCALSTNRSNSRRAFTLIELLVVIAIIAILAAILFPVFAQARDKARQTSCLSNMKQMALGIIQYNQDYDEMFPKAQAKDQYNNGWANSWAITSQPYVKSYAVYRCPSDGDTDLLLGDTTNKWMGVGISYGCNMESYYTNKWNQQGPFGMGSGAPGDFWVYDSLTLAQIKRPAESILLAEQFNSDSKAIPGFPGNPTNYTSGFNSVSWGPNFNGQHNIPNGTISSSIAYPNGPNGGVSAHHASMANFALCDGHVKAMKPASTNPDPVNQPQNDMWVATRN